MSNHPFPNRRSEPSTSALESPHLVPALDERLGPYRVRFARDVADLEAVRRLRYAVFNVELGEGLAGAHQTGLDADAFDRQCQHLMVIEEDSGAVVGTYRMQTSASAKAGHGWYAAGEFELGRLPESLFEESAELGRACVARAHRDRTVLFLLWHGLLVYSHHTGVKAYFGCSSLTGTEQERGVALYAHLLDQGHVHPTLHAPPLPSMACSLSDWPARRPDWSERSMEVPKLFATYLRHGAKVLGPPAIDDEFGTIDFLTYVELGPRHERLFGTMRRT